MTAKERAIEIVNNADFSVRHPEEFDAIETAIENHILAAEREARREAYEECAKLHYGLSALGGTEGPRAVWMKTLANQIESRIRARMDEVCE